jgi:hypothetical protein
MKEDFAGTGWHWLLLLVVHQAHFSAPAREEGGDPKHVARVKLAVRALNLADYREARGKRPSGQATHARTDHASVGEFHC